MGEEKLRPCHCGEPVRVIEPYDDPAISKNRIIFCDSCSGIWCLALMCPRDELVAAWNNELN